VPFGDRPAPAPAAGADARRGAPERAAIADADARENVRHLLSLRDRVKAAGSPQAWVIAPFSHGVPVYLALMANPHGQLRMKPQNLLLNVPLAARS
jgi:hypothetical protein